MSTTTTPLIPPAASVLFSFLLQPPRGFVAVSLLAPVSESNLKTLDYCVASPRRPGFSSALSRPYPGYASRMELSAEAYSLIVGFVGNRSDLCSLCRVSKAFQIAAERALYNTLQMTSPLESIALCKLLVNRPRLASLVVALTISLQDREPASDESSVEDETSKAPSMPLDYWDSIASVLQRTTRIRFLNIYIDNGSDPKQAWVLKGCTFQLQAFHCDLAWDRDLVSFLSSQSLLSDLYIADFNEDTPDTVSITNHSLRLAQKLPKLTILECTFTEVVGVLVPGRPVTHVKSCFSSSEPAAKRAEMSILVENLRLSSRAVCSLNVADSAYTGPFSQEFLSRLVTAFSPDSELRYVGPFVLPVDGRERLAFYSKLRRMPRLQCTELEVSDWDPPPLSFPAMRALASELRMYCPSVTTVIFIHDLEPKVVRAVDGLWRADSDVVADSVWRDV